MAPELDMTPAGLLLNAYHRGGDVEAVLDEVDTREAAAGLAWISAQMGELIAVGKQAPAATGQHVGAAVNGGAQAAQWRARYPRAGS